MKKSFFLTVAAVIVIPLLSGCTTYVVNRPVPPPQTEVVSVAPYSGAIWVGGHWRWAPYRGRYVWVPGHWRAAY